MFDYDYWFGKCKGLYNDLIYAGYDSKEAFKNVETMMHLFDKKYGPYVIGCFLFDFFNEVPD